MPDWPLLQHHPLLCLLLFFFLVGLGLPLPLAPALIVTGALAAAGRISMPLILLVAPLALLPGDFLWYALGRLYGHRVVDTVCLLALERDACIRKTQLTMKRFRLRAFLFGRFLPGFGIVAPPFAGASRQPLLPLLIYDGLGTMLYTTLFLALGYLFADQLALLLPTLSRAGHELTLLLLLALAAYIAYKFMVRYWFAWHLGIPPQAARRRLASTPNACFFDLRSDNDLHHFPYLIPQAHRHSEPEVLATLHDAPPSTLIILFCFCPNQATSTDLARRLRRQGFSSAFSLRGGILAWKAAGFPLEPDNPAVA